MSLQTVYFIGFESDEANLIVRNYARDIERVKSIEEATLIIVPNNSDEYEQNEEVQKAHRQNKMIRTLRKLESSLLSSFINHTLLEKTNYSDYIRTDYNDITEYQLDHIFDVYYGDDELESDDVPDHMRVVRPDSNWDELLGRERIMWANRVVSTATATGSYVSVDNKKLYRLLKAPTHGAAYQWLGKGYRNENLLFWNEKKKTFVFPYIEIDDYGSVPPCFRVGNGKDEFDPIHWIDDVDHNSIIFLSDQLVQEIKNKLGSNQKEKSKKKVCEVKIKGRVFKVIIHHDNDLRTDFHCSNDSSIEQI